MSYIDKLEPCDYFDGYIGSINVLDKILLCTPKSVGTVMSFHENKNKQFSDEVDSLRK